MADVITFRDYRPPSNAAKWTSVDIEEATFDSLTGEPGAWVLVETQAIADYPDPQSPPYMTFTTNLATQVPGWYRLVFHGTGIEADTSPRLYRGTANYRPSTKAVAVHIKNRTVDTNGVYTGDFSNNTEVKRDEVEELISKAENRITRRLDLDPNVPIPTESQAAVTDLVALYAAMLVELTKYSEQVARGVSPYPMLKELYDEQMKEIREDVLGIEADGDISTSGSGTAHFTYPEDVGGMITWTTEF